MSLPRTPWSNATLACAAVVLASCGGRTTLDGNGDDASSLPSFVPDAARMLESDAGRDPCPSAVLAGAGRPIAQNCSTRDGRSRVEAPRSPHVTWKRTLPSANFASLGADASGSVYVSWSLGGPTGDDSSQAARLVLVDGATGEIAWTSTFAHAFSAPPLLLRDGAVDFFAYDVSSNGIIDRLSSSTGKVVSTLAATNATAGDPAVGADGAIYVPGIASTIFRVAPDGATSWQTGELLPGGGEISDISVGPRDLVLFAAEDGSGRATLFGIDPASGATRWTRTWTEEPGSLSDPVVRPDGSIAMLAGSDAEAGTGASILLFEPDGTPRTPIDLSAAGVNAARISVIAPDGAFLLSAYDEAENKVLVALTSRGEFAWRAPVPSGFAGLVTLDSSGTVVVVGADRIEGLDLTTSRTIWTLDAVDASGIVDATLTSAGEIVALESDGVLFGAAD